MRFHPPKFDFRREQQAEREIGATDVSPALRRVLVALFLVTILAVPAADLLLAPRGSGLGVFESIFDLAASPVRAFSSGPGGLWTRLSAANEAFKSRAKVFEDSLKRDSVLARAILPPVQHFSARWLGLGNEQVYLGRDGWLFYRPDFDYAAGPPFLDRVGKRFAQGGDSDPRPALLRLQRDLAARGILLIVVPAPSKPSVEPEYLGARGAPENPSYGELLGELRHEGIVTVDAADLLRAEKARTGQPQFLRTDSHWTPQAMQCVAREVALRLPPARAPSAFRGRGTTDILNTGDLTRMLRLPEDQVLYPAETARIEPVVDAAGNPWRPGGEVLLLGDSFSNIYSGGDLRWGEGAGFAEHLSLASGRGVDRIALNAGGASAARAALARDPGRLDGKTAVVYEFASRELASGEWKVLPLPASATSAGASLGAGKISGSLRELSRAPAPGSLPYRNVIICMHMATAQGDVLVFTYGMKDGVLTGASRLSAGDRIEAVVVPWADVEQRLGSICRQELAGAAADIPDIYWAEEVPVRQP